MKFEGLHEKFRGLRIDAKTNMKSQKDTAFMQIPTNENCKEAHDIMISADYYMEEVQEEGYIFKYIKTLHDEGKLTSYIRRQASKGAKDYLMTICQKNIKTLPHTSQTEGLVRIALLGYASIINVQGILCSPPMILDKCQIITACTHAGTTYMELLKLLEIWYPCIMLASSLEAVSSSFTQEERVYALRRAYHIYKDAPNLANAEKVVIYLLPLAITKVCLFTARSPTAKEAMQAMHRATHEGRGYQEAVRQYIESWVKLYNPETK